MLFGLWLIVVIALFIATVLFVARVPVLGENDPLTSQFLVGITFLMVIITGAYTFQEVKRLQKRIDAIRKLNERDPGT